jgi:putative transposase
VPLALRFVESKVRDWKRPDTAAPLLLGLMADLTRSKRELLAENALLRQQLIVARRQLKRPKLTPRDRLSLLVLACFAKYWREIMLLVKPDTVLRWHRAGFHLFWRRKAKAASNTPRLSREVVALITRLSQENRLWGENRFPEDSEILDKLQELGAA